MQLIRKWSVSKHRVAGKLSELSGFELHDCFSIWDSNSGSIAVVINSQLCALLDFLRNAGVINGGYVWRVRSKSDPIPRRYSCGCVGKNYTSKRYREWTTKMKQDATNCRKERGGVVPKDYPDGWTGGWCGVRFCVLDVVDLTGTGI